MGKGCSCGTVGACNGRLPAGSVKGTQDDLMRIRVSHLRAGERGPLVSCHRMPPSLGWAANTGGEWMAGHDAAVRGLLHEYASRRLSGCARAWQSTAPEPPAYWLLCPSSRRPSRSPSRNDGITLVLICIATCAANPQRSREPSAVSHSLWRVVRAKARNPPVRHDAVRVPGSPRGEPSCSASLHRRDRHQVRSPPRPTMWPRVTPTPWLRHAGGDGCCGRAR